MNRAFKTIWNEARRAYVVTNEAQKTHAKPTKSAVVLAIAATALFSGVASAAYVEQGQLGSTASWETAEYQKDHGLAYINASTAYAEGYTGKGVLIGVVDSGALLSHPDLKGGRIFPGDGFRNLQQRRYPLSLRLSRSNRSGRQPLRFL